jgi:sigma-70-like protein
MQIQHAIHEAVAALPQSQRLVTTLFYIQGYALTEIAAFLEWPIPSIKKHLYTARKRLKARMITMLQGHLRENKPSSNDHLANRVQYGGYTVCIGVEDGAYTANNLMLVWRGWGVDQTTVLVFGRRDDPASTRLQIAEAGLTIAEQAPAEPDHLWPVPIDRRAEGGLFPR